jgi:hypothetical protein
MFSSGLSIKCLSFQQVLENAIWNGKPPDTKSHHILITVAIVATTFIFSTFTDCLGIVLELNVNQNDLYS